MGWLEDFIDSGLEKLSDAVTSICTKIGGAVMNGVSKFIMGIPELGIAVEAVRVILRFISAVADVLIDKPETETPEELGRKAELLQQERGLAPEDFESVEAYIEYLRSEIKVDKAEMEEMSAEELRAYAAVGAGLYVRAMEDRYGIQMEPEFWRAIYKAGIEPSKVPVLIQSMKSAGIEDGKLLDSHFAGNLAAGSKEQQNVHAALSNYAKELGRETGTALLELNRNYNSEAEIK